MRQPLTTRPAVIYAALALASAATRLPFTSRLLYNMDSVQFALAMDRFDVALHQPQPPGYFLYVQIGRLARGFVPDDNAALVAVSVVFSVLTVLMLYRLGRELFGEDEGLYAALFALASPLVWFHGEVALSYMPEAFMSALVATLCLLALKGDKRAHVLSAVALGLAGGIRQNTLVFLMPLWLYSLKGAGAKRAALSVAALMLTVSAWALPMLSATGGLERYRFALRAHWLDSNWRGIHLGWTLFNLKFMAYFTLSGLGLAAAPLMAALVERARRGVRFLERDKAVFFALWLTPAILFHLVVFTHPAVPGHSLIYVVGLIVLAARAAKVAADKLAGGLRAASPGHARLIVPAVIAAANAFYFLATPYPLSVAAIAKHDRVLAGYVEAVKAGFDPADTEVIGADRFLYSYRHAMYYLPGYRVHDTVALTTPDGPMLFWGEGRRTYRARRVVPRAGTRHFIDFLNYEAGKDYGLPAEARTVDAGGGYVLVYYDSPEALHKVKRIAPRLK